MDPSKKLTPLKVIARLFHKSQKKANCDPPCQQISRSKEQLSGDKTNRVNFY
jgi:hypothetical protein